LASRAEFEVADALPLASDQVQPEIQQEPAQRQAEQEERLRVLIVEDELTIRRLLRRKLERQNVLVDEAADGSEGLHKMMEQQYHCVFSDLTMPVMDGFEMIKHFREWEEKSDRTMKQTVFAVSGSCLDEVSSCFPHLPWSLIGQWALMFLLRRFVPTAVHAVAVATASIAGRNGRLLLQAA
jgi:CheY-like chemotaxis protein